MAAATHGEGADMARTRGTGLLMVWTDIDPEYEADYNRWYDEEHIGELLAVPGFLSAGRYVALRGGPKYLALYELDAPEVLRSAAFLDEVRFRASPGRARHAGGSIGRNYLSNGYRQIFPMHWDPIAATREPAPFLQMGRIDIPAMVEEEFNDWYNTAYIPPYLAVPGCLGARRYVAVDGQPKYLTLYEFANADVSESAPWAKARDGNPWSKRVRAFMRHDVGSPGVYRRIWPK
jgi:antibiotic biosynthesis monooxygenase (ABM) superfamily enzyme